MPYDGHEGQEDGDAASSFVRGRGRRGCMRVRFDGDRSTDLAGRSSSDDGYERDVGDASQQTPSLVHAWAPAFGNESRGDHAAGI